MITSTLSGNLAMPVTQRPVFRSQTSGGRAMELADTSVNDKRGGAALSGRVVFVQNKVNEYCIKQSSPQLCEHWKSDLRRLRETTVSPSHKSCRSYWQESSIRCSSFSVWILGCVQVSNRTRTLRDRCWLNLTMAQTRVLSALLISADSLESNWLSHERTTTPNY